MEDGDILAVGTALGSLDLWNVEQMRKVRAMRGHDDRVGCLAWNKVSSAYNQALAFYTYVFSPSTF